MSTLLVIFGFCYYFGLYYAFTLLLKKSFNGIILNKGQRCEVVVRCVSAVQGISACICGVLIISVCNHDVMYSTHWLAKNYAWFGLSYFYYDIWAMLQSVRSRRPDLIGWQSVALTLFKRDTLLVVHHLVLPLVYGPVILWLRGNRGDFFVGCFYLMEVPVLFLSTRSILLEIGKEKGLLYIINGLLLICSWIPFRILVFPYMYYSYSKYSRVPVLSIPASIPLKCTLSTVVIMLLQVYWLYRILKVALRTLANRNPKK